MVSLGDFMHWRPGLECFLSALLCVWLLVRDTEIARPLSLSLSLSVASQAQSMLLKAQVWKRPQLELAPQDFHRGPDPRQRDPTGAQHCHCDLLRTELTLTFLPCPLGPG